MKATARTLLGALAAALLLPGCVGDTKLNEVERAKLIKQNRSAARDLLKKWDASGGREFELLEQYAEMHRRNTEIAPASCPNCWAEYGEALSMIGWHYRRILDDILAEAEGKEGAEAQALREEAEEYRELCEQYFNDSNRAFDAHIRSPDMPVIHPYVFERMMRHYEMLGNYERALYYLQRYGEGHAQLDEVDRAKLEKLRRLYRQELQRQKERGEEPEERMPVPRRPARRRPQE